VLCVNTRLFPIIAIMEAVIQSSLLCRTIIICKSITNYFCHYIFAKSDVFNLGLGHVLIEVLSALVPISSRCKSLCFNRRGSGERVMIV
jgi:hypothetical protein